MSVERAKIYKVAVDGWAYPVMVVAESAADAKAKAEFMFGAECKIGGVA